MSLTPDEDTRRQKEQDKLSDEAKQLRQNYAVLMLQKLDEQIRRGRISDAPRKEQHGTPTAS